MARDGHVMTGRTLVPFMLVGILGALTMGAALLGVVGPGTSGPTDKAHLTTPPSLPDLPTRFTTGQYSGDGVASFDAVPVGTPIVVHSTIEAQKSTTWEIFISSGN